VKVLSISVFLALFVCASAAQASTFDFHNLGTGLGFSKSITVDDLTISLQTSNGALTSSAATFGIDAASASDDPSLLDGAGGTADRLSFIFNKNAIVDSITISLLDGADAGTVTVKGNSTLNLSDGVNTINQPASFTSANFITYTGPLTAGAANGFSIDSISAHTVPEPASLALLAPLVLLHARRRRN